MGLFDKIFGRHPREGNGPAFSTLTAYAPAWYSWDGRIYESELIRAAVHTIATHTSKLAVTIQGSAHPTMRTQLAKQPNSWQTWPQFLYRLRTILEVQCTAFVVPVFDDYGTVVGVFPVLPSSCEVIDHNGEPWLRYRFSTGKTAAVQMSACAVLTKYQYEDDLLGTNNRALNPTMELIGMQRQGITEGIKNSATFRFMARVTNFTKDSDLAKERQRFNTENLRGESGGILLFPNTYNDIKQVDSKPANVDAAQMTLIQTNVFNYFGVNMEVLQNKAFGDAWSAFYEGCIEPFAIQLSDGLTGMLYSLTERGHGNRIFFTSNRLQYMTNGDKLKVSSQLVDRGVMNRDEAREIWNLPPIPDGSGQQYVIRGEYKDAKDTEEGGPDAK